MARPLRIQYLGAFYPGAAGINWVLSQQSITALRASHEKKGRYMMLGKEEQKKIAKLADAMIDIPLVPDFMERGIFEHVISLIDKALDEILPEPFKDLLNSTEGIGRDDVSGFTNKLVEIINRKLDIPYLNEEQESRLFHVVIGVLVKAMTRGKKLADLLPA